MRISCLLPVYNAFPQNARLVNEAVQCFVMQTHSDKELIICNDTPGQSLSLAASIPGVVVYNLPDRFPTLGGKLQWMCDQASGDALCRWDFDDISHPLRLAFSEERMGDLLEWRPSNYWFSYRSFDDPLGFTEVVSPANTHVMALWRREVLDRIGGYPAEFSGNEDSVFNDRLRLAGISANDAERLSREDIFYFYRWGTNSIHLSGKGGGAPDNPMQPHYDEIGTRPIVSSTFYIHPAWQRNYVTDFATVAALS